MEEDYDYESYSDCSDSEQSEQSESDSSSGEEVFYDDEDEEYQYSLNEEKKKCLKKNNNNNYFGYCFLNTFEKTRILGKRTEQIIAGSKIFVETKNKNPYEIALQELHEKKMPLIIRRYFGNNKFKDVSVNDLIIL